MAVGEWVEESRRIVGCVARKQHKRSLLVPILCNMLRNGACKDAIVNRNVLEPAVCCVVAVVVKTTRTLKFSVRLSVKAIFWQLQA